ncbi:MAG TPA: dTDP-4-dehydrorhamnose 3,5-epimerase family protein, partial [Candidatus Acidoferrales bacterium]|nr:dTDP-4-dehydrorhamnose 3,5-epimerase family protein [Candidatus Acidoferrales bacterium]
VLSSAAIEGVIVRPLEFVPGSRGDVMEVERADDSTYPGFGQAYITCTNSGEVKAWYRHAHIDQMAVVSGLIKLVLFDPREGSATHGQFNEIALGDVAPRLVQIPAGVWQGFKVLSADMTFLLHLSSHPFKLDSPEDEYLPYNHPSIPYRW